MIHTLLRWLLGALLRVRVEGDLSVLRGGRKLVIANHDSLLDGVLLGLFLPGLATVVVTPEALRHPLVRLFRGTLRFLVLDPARPLAVKRLIRQVQRGEVVAIFPQGRVSTTGTTMKVYDSA
ncbi:MAG: 1-acyl-sn-glycerol-3-phosphate acyltransferase, partial [Burkholderiales bacterium]